MTKKAIRLYAQSAMQAVAKAPLNTEDNQTAKNINIIEKLKTA